MIPAKKRDVPRSFEGWRKRFFVRVKPRIRKSPERKSRLPTASRPESKKSRIPRIVKSRPMPVSPIPIFLVSPMESIVFDAEDPVVVGPAHRCTAKVSLARALTNPATLRYVTPCDAPDEGAAQGGRAPPPPPSHVFS